jgi:hypothetical protein
MINLSHRNNITNLLPYNSIGCELGVFEGNFSQELYSSGKFDRLYLIDIFAGHACNFGKHYMDASVLYDMVKNKFLQCPEIEVVKQDSISFLKTTDIKFDFIYIDTVHSYEHLKQELSLAHNVIKSCGYICGHDYCDEFSGVINAVLEFSEKHRYEVIITEENSYPSFIIHTK